ncbi:MAG: HAD family hydrolase [Eubacterium sp.]|nr:HAD family hydrolase [Eubacterium sp.]
MKYEYVIWDWNGTLFNDVQISIDTMNKMLEVKEYPQRLDTDLYKSIFSFPVVDYYIKVGLDFEKHSFDELAQLFIDLYSEVQDSAELFDSVRDVLKYFNSLGLKQSVISVCEKERLYHQISLFDIEDYFDDVIGTDDNYAVSKADIAKKWFADHELNPDKAVFIGDTVHDYEVARAVGCDSILIADGHQSREVLSVTDAVIINCISDIKEIFN